jgi:hypothetical protein
MKYQFISALIFASVLICHAQAQNDAPVIKHAPVTAAVRGQSVVIRAVVNDDSGKLKSVTLNCTASSDSTPVKVPMQDAGAGSYLGAVPDSLVKSADQVKYYIEATDELDRSAETPWYTITFKASSRTTGNGQVTPAGTSSGDGKEKESSWRTPLLIAGGTALAVGGAVVAASMLDDDDDDSPGTSTNGSSEAGTYSGSATRYLQVEGSPLVTFSYLVTFSVTSNNVITTSNLHPGSSMQATLSGSDFVMNGAIADSGNSGSIQYSGTVLNGRISGSMAGTATLVSGTNGTYSGVFSAIRE